jgi:signal transduction histidine kinase
MAIKVFTRHVPVIALAVLASAITSSDAFAEAQPPYAVLAIHWGPEDYPATPELNAAIRQALTSDANVPIDYFTEYLESDILDVRSASEALAEYIRRKYRERRIDVVLAIADPALRFVLDYRTELFPNAAIVYSGIAIPESNGRRALSVTGELRGAAFVETLKFALKLHPSTEQVFVIANAQDRKNVEAVRASLDALSWPTRLVYLDEPSVSGLIAAVAAIKPRSLVLYVWYSEREGGSLLDTAQAARLVVEAAAVPVYVTNERYIGSGAVGGVVRSRQGTGTRMAEMAREIIAGKRVEDMPFEDARLVPIVDWREVQRWRINPSQLPGGSDIRFKAPTVWESYRFPIIAIVVVMAGQLVLIGGLMTQHARRHRAENALRTNEATLRTSYERTRQLAARLIDAQEKARAAIARDLHDDICQDLVALSLAICRLRQSSNPAHCARVQQELSKLQQWAQALADGVRRFSHDLHPATLGLLGLAPAIKGHCNEIRKRQGVDVRFSAIDDLGDIDRVVAVGLFRMAQEALRNGLVHGRARHLAVSIARSGDQIELTVSDDGVGFDPGVICQNGTGLGLVSMEERANALGGAVHITSVPGGGTTVFVRVPAADRSAADAEAGSASMPVPKPDAGLPAMERVRA